MNAPRVAQENPIPQSYVNASAPEQDPELGLPLEEDFSPASWVTVRNPRTGAEQICCSNCGEERRAADEEAHETVRRIVRENFTFGYGESMVHGGGEVRIEPRHLTGPLLDSTCSPREWDAEQERKRRRIEKAPPMLLGMVKRSATAGKAEVEELNRRGREAMVREIRARSARASELLRRGGRPVDQEDDAPARRDVDAN